MTSPRTWAQACDASFGAGVCEAGGGWDTGLLDTAGEPGGLDRALYTHACFCLAAGDVAERTGGCYVIDCCLASSLGCLYCLCEREASAAQRRRHEPTDSHTHRHADCIPWGITRRRFRRQRGIPGSLLGDVATAMFCPPCVFSQQLNQLDIDAARLAAAASRAAEDSGPVDGVTGAPRAAAVSATAAITGSEAGDT
jgi:Cys-rich protein (TIGR01571 family)